MFKSLARLATTRPRIVLAAAAVFFAVSAGLGGGVSSLLTAGGFEDPSSESSRADDVLAEEFGTGVPNVVLLVTAKGGDVDDPAVTRAGQALTDELATEPDLTSVVSYWSEGRAPPLRTDDRDRALVVGRIDADDDELADRIAEIAPRYRAAAGDGVVTVQVGGFAEQFDEVGVTLDEDLIRAELIALPITLLLLVVIFRSVVAASLPLVIGLLSIVSTFLVLRVTASLTDVSVFALNLTTALGLGLAIDYSLFMVSRYREELRADHEPRAAVRRTVWTAGRTVAFSALTVAAALSATLVFPVVVLRSFAYAGVAVALLAGLFSVLVLPAILTMLGDRVNALAIRRRSVDPPEEGRWFRVANLVMRRPVPIATGVIALLLVLGAPFLGLRLSQADDRVLPESAQSRQVGDVVREEFSSEEAAALSVVAPDIVADSAVDTQIDAYAARLANLHGVARVDAATGTYCGEGSASQLRCEAGQRIAGPDVSGRYERYSTEDGTYLSVVPAVEPFSSEGEQLVADVRAADAPFPVLVTGRSAILVDTKDALFSRLPLALAFVAVVTFALLFMMFGSVVIPAKALVLNVLSLSATFGAMVWIFQDGNLAGLLGVTATGGLDPVIPILMFCIAFGLSMDYEVFLLSRIKEEHDRGAGNERSIALGLARTGHVITGAALVISVVFLAFATSRVSFITMFGLGLALAVLLDAFVIRGTLVPAFMRLAGDWNWWAPRPLRRFHDHYGISEHVDLSDEADERKPVAVDQGEEGGSGEPVAGATPVPPRP